MNAKQKKALSKLRPELQKQVIELASKKGLNMNTPMDQQQPIDTGLFSELKTKDQLNLL